MTDIALNMETVKSVSAKLYDGTPLSDGESEFVRALMATIIEDDKDGATSTVLKWGDRESKSLLLLLPIEFNDLELAIIRDVAIRFAKWMRNISLNDTRARMEGEAVDVDVKTDNLQVSYDGKISGMFWQLSMKFKNYK